jgi:hypothetical protein
MEPKIKTTRECRGSYKIEVGGYEFTAETLEFIYDDGSKTASDGWRLLIVEDGQPEWCNDFMTLWECKEAALGTVEGKEAN